MANTMSKVVVSIRLKLAMSFKNEGTLKEHGNLENYKSGIIKSSRLAQKRIQMNSFRLRRYEIWRHYVSFYN